MEPLPPIFTRFFFPDEMATRLEIPKRFSPTLGEIVFLNDKNNNCWAIELEEDDGCRYFTNGWTEFVKDNSIIEMDLLVFQYFNGSSLDFKILGLSGCEKEGCGPTFGRQQEQLPNDVQNERETSKHKGDEEYEDDNDEYEPMAKARAGNAGASSSKKQRKRRAHLDPYGNDIFEAGLAPRPKCQYFVTRTNPKRMNELYIPQVLLKDECLYLPEKLSLVDPKGRTYSAELKQWSDGRTFYKGGWGVLCRRNGIRTEDYCICEFGEKEQRNYLFISFLVADDEKV